MALPRSGRLGLPASVQILHAHQACVPRRWTGFSTMILRLMGLSATQGLLASMMPRWGLTARWVTPARVRIEVKLLPQRSQQLPR